MLSNRFILLFILLILGGCATKFRVPLNRMLSPESVGGAFNTEFEIGQQGQAEGRVDVSKSSPFPLEVSQRSGTSYFGALSFLDNVDFFWNHTANAPSLVGARVQFMGNSQASGGTGHSMALTAAFGGNEHEIEGSPRVEMELSATDFSLIHGYWFTPYWQVFETFAVSQYQVNAKLSGTVRGEVEEDLKMMYLAAGTALIFKPVKVKLEASYAKLDWSKTDDDSYISYALVLGFNF